MKQYLNKLYYVLWVVFVAILIIFTQWWITNWKQWLDLNGWVRLLYKMDFSQYEKNYNSSQLQQQKSNVINIVKKNIDSRISKLWVSDYNARYVVLWWQDYIEISLWWVDNLEKAKEIIWKTVKMTFRVPFEWVVTPEIKNQRQLLAEKLLTLLKTQGINSITDYINPPRAWNIDTNVKAFTGTDLEKTFWTGIISSLTWAYIYPKLVKTDKSFNIYQYIWKKDNKYNFMEISVNFKPSREDAKIDWKLLNWERFKMATVQNAQSWEPAVAVYFDDIWRSMLWDITKKYLKKQMAIFVWNKLVTDPVIQAEIDGWVAQITWRFTYQQAKDLAENLNTWAMPVSLSLEQEEKVAPTLWKKAFRNSLIAAWIWLILIFIMFAVFYDFTYALVTLLSLWLFFIVLWGFIKLFGIVLSLSAIWAILLNIGMAVDANVLIFERVKEELKAWSSFITAIQSGYKNSFSAIRDGNATTWLIAFLLFMIGTNIFKWFGTMMIINIFIILFPLLLSIIHALLHQYSICFGFKYRIGYSPYGLFLKYMFFIKLKSVRGFVCSNCFITYSLVRFSQWIISSFFTSLNNCIVCGFCIFCIFCICCICCICCDFEDIICFNSLTSHSSCFILSFINKISYAK